MSELLTTPENSPPPLPDPHISEPSLASSLGYSTLEFLKIFIIAALIILPIRLFVIQPFYVKGQSMEPNFHDNEYLIIDKLSPRFRAYERGEVVVLRFPRPQAPYLIKRIVGLPGERVVLFGDTIRIFNSQHPKGMQLNESDYTPRHMPNQHIDQILADDEYFILGDNRPNSIGSQTFGPIKGGQIVGRVSFRGLPFDKIKVFSAPTYE